MFTKSKYQAVSSQNPEEQEIPVQKNIVSSLCFWTTLRTCVLLALYFAPSIGLTFYQRWLLQVSGFHLLFLLYYYCEFIMQTFHFPLSIVLCHLVVKFMLASIIRSILSWRSRTPRIVLDWKSYCRAVAATGVASGIDVGLSNWGLEFITITL